MGLLTGTCSVIRWESLTPDPIYEAGLISPKEKGHMDNWLDSSGDRQLSAEMMKSLWSNCPPLTHTYTDTHSHTVQLFHNKKIHIKIELLCSAGGAHIRGGDAQYGNSCYKETLSSFRMFNFCNLFIQRFRGNKEPPKYANTDKVWHTLTVTHIQDLIGRF